MGEIMDLYSLVRDLIDESKKQKNLELTEKLIEIKIAIYELKEENDSLKKQIEIQKRIIRHKEAPFITLDGDEEEIMYCSTCFGKDGKLIQFAQERCPVCKTRRIKQEMKISY